jgi:transposase InsO family protein
MSLDDARRKCEAWRRDYNEERPHSAIGNKALSNHIAGGRAGLSSSTPARTFRALRFRADNLRHLMYLRTEQGDELWAKVGDGVKG